MHLVTYEREGGPQPALLRDGELVDVPGVASVLDLVGRGADGLATARAALERPPSANVADVRLLAPIPAPARFVLATGWNYRAHFDEGVGKRNDEVTELPEYPSFFAKADTTVSGPSDVIPFDPKLSDQMDSEAEIAVVIGTAGRNIPVEKAHRHIFGYTLANDVSARDIQRRHGGQWLKGKSIDGSCPLGPALVTADEFGTDESLDLACAVNGEVMQEATTALMIFSIPELISSLSEAMMLVPGDILLTGTPEGVGYARNPPRFLAPGDEVVVSSTRLGELRNRVAERSLTTYVSDPYGGASQS